MSGYLLSGSSGGSNRTRWFSWMNGYINTGSPTQNEAATYGLPYFSMPNSAQSAFQLPAVNFPYEWSSADVYLWVLTLTTHATANIVPFVQIRSIGDGDDVTSGADVDRTIVLSGAYSVTGGVSNTIRRIPGETGIDLSVFTDRPVWINMQRAGSDALDTWEDAIGFVGLELVKAS